MAIYHGVIRDNRVELEEGAHLAEGTRVEVHTADDAAATRAAEEALIRRMYAEGLIDKPSTDDTADDDEEFEPIVVQGEPLSEQIIRERR